MKILSIVRTNLVRALRDRTALFFSILLPLILILVLGLTYGAGSAARIGVLDEDGGPRAAELVTAVSAAPGITVEVRTFDSLGALREAVARGIVSVGIGIPADYSAAIADGVPGELRMLTPPTERANAVRTLVDEAIAHETAIVRAAQLTVTETGRSFEEALSAARGRSAAIPGVGLSIEPVNATTAGANGYGAGAQSQLILFMFLTSLTGAVELVLTRQLGVSRRMFSTPTGAGTIIAGESLARIAFALAQGAFIVAASSILFGVDWGNGAAVAAVVAVFAVVAGGAAMIVGSVAASPSQAGALGPALGMLLGLIGGAMVPLEVFPEAMRQVARLTPHAWAMDALAVATNAGSAVTDIVADLAVLAGFAAVFFGIAVVRFRRSLVGAA